MAGLSYFGELLVVALTPAICEEALHRGLLQYSLRGIKKKWVMLLLMGVYFGAFHMSIVRFLPMMMMGIVLSYVRMKTDNMFYSSLFHFAGERSSRQRIRNGNVHRHVSDRSGADADRSLYGKPSSDVPADKKRRIFPEGEKKKDHCKNRNSDHSADPWRTVFPWYWYDVKRIKSSLGNFAEMSKPGRKQVRFMIE